MRQGRPDTHFKFINYNMYSPPPLLWTALGGDMQFHLSEWLPWNKRDQLPDVPGVYLIAKATPENVIYIGKTWGGEGLRRRLRNFHRSACSGNKGHSGGVTYSEIFGSNTADLLIATHLSQVIRPDPAIFNAYILFVERTLIWEYVELHGRIPVCNAE